MSDKKLIWLGASVGGIIGSYMPSLWHASLFSPWSILLGGVGGLLGIWAGASLL